MREPDDWIEQDTILTPFLCNNVTVSMEDEERENVGMTYELHCGLSDLEKAIVVSFATTFIDEESVNVDAALANIIEILEYSYDKYQRNLHAVEAMINSVGLHLLNTLKTVSVTDKTFIKQAVDYAYYNGGDKNDMMYNLMLSILGFNRKLS